MKFLAIQFVFTFLLSILHAQTTFDIDTLELNNFPVSKINYSEWGDFNNDNNLDLLVSWTDTSQITQTSILSNQGNSQFFPIITTISPIVNGDVELLDYDKDNDVDLLLAGVDQNGASIIQLYTNNNGTFQLAETEFPAIDSPKLTTLDFDNNGYPDILLTGLSQNSAVTLLLSNQGNGTFTEKTTSLPILSSGSYLSIDLNNDTFFDLILCGMDSANNPKTQIFLNNSGTDFTNLNISLTGFSISTLAASDFDNDGDFDVLISGQVSDSSQVTQIIRNDSNLSFTEIDAGLPAKMFEQTAWGDFDNNGFSDILLFSPNNSDTALSKVYFNNGDASFTPSGLLKSDSTVLEITIADVDADASLNFLTIQKDTTHVVTAQIFKNTTSFNTIPQSPANLTASFSQTSMTFKWDASEDNQTNTAGLSYNIRIGTTPGGSEITSPQARENGFGKIISSGNLGKVSEFSLPVETINRNPMIYWSVQAIDPSYARSFFSDEQVFVFDFTENEVLSESIDGINAGSTDWGDYDNDGDFDLLLTGQDAANGRIAKIYRNDGNNVMTELDVGLTGLASSSGIWLDYNNDEFLDIVISGFSSGNTDFAEIYRNDGHGTFTPINSGLMGAFQSELDWGDFDNDGDADILQSGFSLTSQAFTAIYRNDSGVFTKLNIDLANISDGASLFCDFDNDGLLDVLLSGNAQNIGRISKIYKNTGDNFIETSAELIPLSASAAAVADYDNDGDSDILLTGLTETERLSSLFINNGNMEFEQSDIQLEGVSNGSAAFGDYDNDGDFDLMLSGFDNDFLRISKVYTNNGNSFSEISSFLRGVIFGTTDWVDIDNDNDLDIFITGSSNTERVAKLYQNNTQNPNTLPGKPEVPVATLIADGVNFEWLKTNDSETNQNALTYNLRIGSSPGGSDILSGLASTATGTRQIVKNGNTGHNTFFTLKFEDILNYPSMYWSVQAIDNTYDGSLFSDEGSLNPVITAVRDVPNDQGKRVSVEWQASSLDHDLNALTSYTVWRALPVNSSTSNKKTRQITINQETFAWEWLATLPAHRRPVYSYTSETLFDSTSSSTGSHLFIVAAHTNDSNIFFDSLPVSGYSLDNIPPEAPQNLVADFDGTNIRLKWRKNEEADFRNYIVYQSNHPGILIENSIPFAEVVDTSFTFQSNEPINDSYFIVAAQDSSDNISNASNEASLLISNIEEITDLTPQNYSLYQNYPNPFNPSTKIDFDLPEDSFVKIQVFNIMGETIRTLVNGKQSAGQHTILFNGHDLPSGTYFYQITAGAFKQIRKMTLLR